MTMCSLALSAIAMLVSVGLLADPRGISPLPASLDVLVKLRKPLVEKFTSLKVLP